MISTVNAYGRTHFASSVNNKESKGIPRGQSLNYTKKNAANQVFLDSANYQKNRVSYGNNKPG